MNATNSSIESLVARSQRASADSQGLLVLAEDLLVRRAELVDQRIALLREISERGRDFCDAIGIAPRETDDV